MDLSLLLLYHAQLKMADQREKKYSGTTLLIPLPDAEFKYHLRHAAKVVAQ